MVLLNNFFDWVNETGRGLIGWIMYLMKIFKNEKYAQFNTSFTKFSCLEGLPSSHSVKDKIGTIQLDILQN